MLFLFGHSSISAKNAELNEQLACLFLPQRYCTQKIQLQILKYELEIQSSVQEFSCQQVAWQPSQFEAKYRARSQAPLPFCSLFCYRHRHIHSQPKSSRPPHLLFWEGETPRSLLDCNQIHFWKVSLHLRASCDENFGCSYWAAVRKTEKNDGRPMGSRAAGPIFCNEAKFCKWNVYTLFYLPLSHVKDWNGVEGLYTMNVYFPKNLMNPTTLISIPSVSKFPQDLFSNHKGFTLQWHWQRSWVYILPDFKTGQLRWHIGFYAQWKAVSVISSHLPVPTPIAARTHLVAQHATSACKLCIYGGNPKLKLGVSVAHKTKTQGNSIWSSLSLWLQEVGSQEHCPLASCSSLQTGMAYTTECMETPLRLWQQFLFNTWGFSLFIPHSQEYRVANSTLIIYKNLCHKRVIKMHSTAMDPAGDTRSKK